MNPNQLINKAILAQKNSKSQYSNFPVGCAILTETNEVILGCNVESAVYPKR